MRRLLDSQSKRKIKEILNINSYIVKAKKRRETIIDIELNYNNMKKIDIIIKIYRLK